MFYGLIRAIVGLETGRDCRRCRETILRTDVFGMSEGVCDACRQ